MILRAIIFFLGGKLAKVWLKRYKSKSEAGLRVIKVTDEAVGNSFREKQEIFSVLL